MVGFFTSLRRAWVSCGLVGGACAALLPTAAAAATIETVSFAEAALVTQWSLPSAPRPVGPLPEPTFIASLEVPAPPAAEAADTRSASPVGRAEAAYLAGVAGPVLADSDLEARGFTTYERQRPYRTPVDIKRLTVAFQILNAADAISTVACLQREDCQETNPVYGKHPKPIVVIGAKSIVGAIHYWAMRSLSRDHPGMARAFGWFTVTVQGGTVGLNMSQLF
jgi:hypothetical protein